MGSQVEVGGIHAAQVGRVVVVVREHTSFSLPEAELPDLIAALTALRGQSGANAPTAAIEAAVAATLAAVPLAEPPKAAEPAPAAPEAEAPTAAPETVAADASAPAKAQAGQLWDAVRAHLDGAERAQGFASLLRAALSTGYPPRQAEHALRVLLRRRLASGDVKETASGRYRL